MYILAIDPGVMNLAVAVVEANTIELCKSDASRLSQLCAHTRLAHWQRIDLSAGLRNATHTQLCAELVRRLDLMAPLYAQCAAVGIEHQMASNHDANAVQNYALAYFMCRYPTMHVQLIRPLWKTLHLGPLSEDAGVPRHNLAVYSGRKKWSVATIGRCRELWNETPDQLYRPALNWQYQPETWKTWELCADKQDDLADAALMILGWLVHEKGNVVPLPKPAAKIRTASSAVRVVKQRPTPAQRRRAQASFVHGGQPGGHRETPTPQIAQQTQPGKPKRKWSRRKLVRL